MMIVTGLILLIFSMFLPSSAWAETLETEGTVQIFLVDPTPHATEKKIIKPASQDFGQQKKSSPIKPKKAPAGSRPSLPKLSELKRSSGWMLTGVLLICFVLHQLRSKKNISRNEKKKGTDGM